MWPYGSFQTKPTFETLSVCLRLNTKCYTWLFMLICIVIFNAIIYVSFRFLLFAPLLWLLNGKSIRINSSFDLLSILYKYNFIIFFMITLTFLVCINIDITPKLPQPLDVKRGIGCNSHSVANLYCAVSVLMPCTGTTASSDITEIGDLFPWYILCGNFIWLLLAYSLHIW